jgi:hypothetical protein
MRQQVGRHERSVRVAAHRDPATVANPTFDEIVDCSPGTGDELSNVFVVRFPAIATENRHLRVVEHAVATGERE